MKFVKLNFIVVGMFEMYMKLIEKSSFFLSYCFVCSDTGTEVPERCVFGFMLSTSAFLGNNVFYMTWFLA